MAKSGQSLGGSLRYELEQRNGATRIALSGHISEAANFAPLKALAGPLVFDLGKVEGINSLGVREWIYFVRDRETSGVSLTFERCSPMLVLQMSMISNFMGTRSKVASVLVPYFCPSCQNEIDELLELGPRAAVKSTIPCPKCGAGMELDELMEAYNRLLGDPTAKPAPRG